MRWTFNYSWWPTLALLMALVSAPPVAHASNLADVDACAVLSDDEAAAVVGSPITSHQEMVQEPVHICLGDTADPSRSFMVRVETPISADARGAAESAWSVTDHVFDVSENIDGMGDHALWQVWRVADSNADGFFYPAGTDEYMLWFGQRDTFVGLFVVTARYEHDDARAKAAMMDAAQHILGRLP
jgi:hypothetical protein